MSIDNHELWLIQERDEAERQLAMARQEIEHLRQREDALMKALTNIALTAVNPPIKPMMLAHAESYEAGRIKGQTDLADHLREDIAQLVEAMGMQGYGTLAIAAAIRKGKS